MGWFGSTTRGPRVGYGLVTEYELEGDPQRPIIELLVESGLSGDPYRP